MSDIKIVYIVGLGHSGSTLLDMILGAHSQAFSVGSLRKLPYFASKKGRGSRCACGARRMEECRFWSSARYRLQNWHGLDIASEDITSTNPVVFKRFNSILYENISQLSGKSLLIESSKTVDRLDQLQSVPGLTVIPLYLIRNPKGQIASSYRRGHGTIDELVDRFNCKSFEVEQYLQDKPYMAVSYEHFVSNPVAELERLMGALELVYEQQQLQWAEQVKHNVGGNPIRFQANATLQLDERWKHELTLAQQWWIDLKTIKAQRRNQALMDAKRGQESLILTSYSKKELFKSKGFR